MLHFRGEMNELYAAVHELEVPPPSIPSRPLPEPPSLSPTQFIPPLPILTPTPAYQEATTNHVKFQLPGYDETHDAPMPVAHSDGMLFLPAFPDDSALDDYPASPLAVPPVYSSVLPDIGTWSREKENDKSKWFASGVGVDPSLLGLLDARTITGYVPLTQGDNTTFWPHFGGEDTASDSSSEAGQFLTGTIPVEDNSELREDEGLPIHINISSAHRAAELSPLGLSLVSSPEVRPRPPDDDELSDTGTSSTDEVESDSPRPRTNRQISLTSSLTLLKTPKHHPRLDASYLQTRLHELLEDNLGLGLGHHNLSSSLGFGLARSQTGLRIPNFDIDLQQNFGRTQSTTGNLGGGRSLGQNPSRRHAGLNDEPTLGVDVTLTPRHGPSKKKSKPNLKSKAKYNPRQLKSATSTPMPQIEGLPTTSSISTPAVTSLSITRPRPNRSRSDSETFRSRIPRFALPKSQASDSDSDGGEHQALGSTLNGALSSGLMLDPNALAERFMEELQGCLVEVIARVFVQMLAELRVGASVSVAHGRKARGREAMPVRLDSGSEGEGEEGEGDTWDEHGYEYEDDQGEDGEELIERDDTRFHEELASAEPIVGAESPPSHA
ncbi:hypothetical protein CPB83DRAFT_856638 [Crepidotus variabilis]|uniref:Uncharacterized protein n=1 Tax=Crepidotus variabilis TaxID=179855 RepID=A0A9P6JP47_9AGAR|nr:hypothetical protein CPB83DRAFT_856638 [Crepidotus variabilis]